MKVLVLGNELIVQRLAIALGLDGIEVDSIHDRLPDVLEIVESRRYNLIIVDSQLENAGRLCAVLGGLSSTPVSLILSDNSDDWKIISRYKVDGFLVKEASDNELRTRVRAACRRRFPSRLAV